MKNLFTTITMLAVMITLAWCTSTSNDAEATVDNAGSVVPGVSITTDSAWDNIAINTITYTMDQIAAANTEDNCLTVIDNKVYDLTAWIDQHPWWDRNILRICGIDGTSAFQGKHGGQSSPEATLEWFQVGIFAQ